MAERSYSVADAGEEPLLLMEWALLSRCFVLIQAIYFMVIAFSFEGPDQYMFQMGLLPTGPAFFVAGLLGILILFFPRSRFVLIAWLLSMGLACIGRQFSILMMARDLLPADWTSEQVLAYRVRAMGWGLQVLGAIVAITQIIAAAALGRTRAWAG